MAQRPRLRNVAVLALQESLPYTAAAEASPPVGIPERDMQVPVGFNLGSKK